MAKFFAHGSVVEEPIWTKLKNGIDVVKLVIEERSVTLVGQEVNTYEIEFTGKLSTLVPRDKKLIGSVVIVEGNVTSHEYNGRHFINLRGQKLCIVSENDYGLFGGAEQDTKVEEDASIRAVVDETLGDDDDLPF